MILSHQKRFIFICNGKTGTTSIEKVLQQYNEAENLNVGIGGLWVGKHIPPAVLKSFLPKETWESYYKFVFVRQPHDWFISQYKYNFSRPASPIRSMLRRPHHARAIYANWKYFTLRARKTIYDVEDVDLLYEYIRRYRGMPLSPSLFQTSYAFDEDGEQIVDFIGKFEQISSCMDVINDKLGLSIELPHLNKTKHSHWRECLTPKAIMRINELWEKDFLNYDYEFEEA